MRIRYVRSMSRTLDRNHHGGRTLTNNEHPASLKLKRSLLALDMPQPVPPATQLESEEPSASQ
jgi:hypothetical protein